MFQGVVRLCMRLQLCVKERKIELRGGTPHNICKYRALTKTDSSLPEHRIHSWRVKESLQVIQVLPNRPSTSSETHRLHRTTELESIHIEGLQA